MKSKKEIKNKSYDHQKIEKRWQKFWDENKVYKTLDAKSAISKKLKPHYVLDMFPYPSGAGLHVGHPRGYIGSDVYARMKRMQGYNVLHPMGFDSFGLPAEQYAIKTGKHPGPFTDKLVEQYKKQLSIIGFSYDWDRMVTTHNPEYYKFTQEIFLKIYNSYFDTKKQKAFSIDNLINTFEKSGNKIVNENTAHGDVSLFTAKEWKAFSKLQKQDILMNYRLAYVGYAEVNWCPELGTVLANDEIVDTPNGPVSERGEYPVVKKSMRQWFMRISAYGDRLLDGLNHVDFLDSTKETQRNWIGRSVGSEIEFKIFVTNPTLTLPKGEGIEAPGYVTTDSKLYPELHSKALEMRKNPTISEGILWEKLRDNKLGNHFRRQHIIGNFIADFVCLDKNLIIEIDGDIHKNQIERDQERTNFLNSVGFCVLRFTNNDVLNNINSVLDKINNKLNENSEAKVLSFGEDLGGVSVFTTRADTIFGATYIVLAPEHELVTKLKNQITNWNEIEKYIATVKNKTNEERQNSKTKTGVEVKGLYAVNPANNEKIPVWIADYVLASYGTGAVMAVPAHDERDFEFANKYNLSIKQVVAPHNIDQENPPKPGKENTKRNIIHAIVEHPTENKIISLVWKDFSWRTLITGGIEEGENAIDAAKREIIEETGFYNLEYVKKLPYQIFAEFYAHHKDVNRAVMTNVVYFKLKDLSKKKVSDSEKALHEVEWINLSDIGSLAPLSEIEHIIKWLKIGDHAYTGSGILINSGKFNGLNAEEVKEKITKFVGGKVVTKYKMRDAIFARQRYWGEPIPLYKDKDGLIHEVKKLPLVLPNLKSFAPSGNGESPLANSKEWVKNGYETNTMPGWAGSSWYFLRYTDPKNKKQIASKENLDFFFGKNGGVDMYIGGTEHNTGHLLYARFWHKVLHDLGVVKSDEPFKSLRHQGMIGGADGRKMSKRWGNVINPDDIVKTYGADTLRVYEMFLGPFDSHLPWNTESIMGSRRFIERVWRANNFITSKNSSTNIDISYALNDLITKVTDDINEFKFNTAISAMMIFLGLVEDKNYEISNDDFIVFIKLLAPFAPYVADEIYSNFGFKSSIHKNDWPKLKKLKKRILMQKIIVQFNGKLRGEVLVMPNTKQEEIVGIINMDDKYRKYFESGELVRTIFIPNKIINFVIKNN